MTTAAESEAGPAAARQLLSAAVAALGGDSDGAERVAYRGWDDGYLASALPCLPAMSAAVGAALMAVADVDAGRTGGVPAGVHVDARQVAVAARSERYAHRIGEEPPNLFAPLSRFWRASDGWFRTHANYAWHKERALGVLGCPDDADAFAAAVAERTGTELEEAFAAAGALGFAVRDRDSWLAHPQGQAVNRHPVLYTDPGVGRPRSLPAGRALDGVRVLDMTRVIAGPVATRTLAAWGADVLRIDSPALPEIEAQTIDTLPGKRSARLDASSPTDRQLLDELLQQADVLVQGYRPGGLAKHGLSAEALSQSHPHLTVVTVSAWGRTGPWSDRRGFDSLVQCPTGIASTEGDAQRPGTLPAQVLDHATGYLAAAAAASSLARAARGQPPSAASLSLAQTAEWLQSLGAMRRPEPVEPEAGDLLIDLQGAGQHVRVVAPPGDLDGTRPLWTSTTALGADAAVFLSVR